MRVIFLSPTLTILLCFIIWPILQVGAALFCLYLPDRFFLPNAFFYRAHRFEKNGQFYNRIFHASRWKHLLPDGGVVLKKRGFRKKKLESTSGEYLQKFLVESCRAELTHWLAILPFWLFWLFTPPAVPWMMLLYALLVNLPCIIVQRYNRPRIKRLIQAHKIRQER